MFPGDKTAEWLRVRSSSSGNEFILGPVSLWSFLMGFILSRFALGKGLPVFHRLALDSPSSCLSLLGAVFKGMHNHTRQGLSLSLAAWP